MVNENQSEAVNLEAGTTPEVVGEAISAPTFAVDGIAGMAFSKHLTKVTFVEHFPQADVLQAKAVANFVMANDQFLKIVDALSAVAKDMRALEGTEES